MSNTNKNNNKMAYTKKKKKMNTLVHWIATIKLSEGWLSRNQLWLGPSKQHTKMALHRHKHRKTDDFFFSS